MTKIIEYFLSNGLVSEYNNIPKGERNNNYKNGFRLNKISEFHKQHPEYSRKDLICFMPETDYMIEKYFKLIGEKHAK